MVRVLLPLIAGLLLLAASGASARGAETAAGTVATGAAAGTRDETMLRRLYERRAAAPIWLGDGSGELRRKNLADLLAREPGRLDEARRLAGAASVGSPAGRNEAELAWTRLFLAYLARRNGGEPVESPAAVERALALLAGPPPGSALGAALLDLRIVEALGGWRPVRTYRPEPVVPVSTAEARLRAFVEGRSTGAVLVAAYEPEPVKPRPVRATLRTRLVQAGDLAIEDAAGPGRSGDALDRAVRRFQLRHGLAEDGVVGPKTLAMLNTPIADQIRQIELNLARAPHYAGRDRHPRYVEVNVPAFELRLVEAGRVVLRSRVIVGELDNPTPIFDESIRFLELNPSWYVPPRIAGELAQEHKGDPGYFVRQGFVWRTGESAATAPLMQRPGPDNALGRVKFMFPNRHAVYLHDTPKRGLFARSERSLSNGCVRVEKATDLALALLGSQGWDGARYEAALATARTQRVELDRPVPVFLDYRTAFIDDDGLLHLHQDLYGHDGAGTGTFATKGLRLPRTRPPEPELRPALPEAPATGGEDVRVELPDEVALAD